LRRFSPLRPDTEPGEPGGCGANPKKPKGAATLSAAPHWITPGKNYLQGKGNLERTG